MRMQNTETINSTSTRLVNPDEQQPDSDGEPTKPRENMNRRETCARVVLRHGAGTWGRLAVWLSGPEAGRYGEAVGVKGRGSASSLWGIMSFLSLLTPSHLL